MHLLPCPACNSQIPVSPSQAGDETNCPDCQAVVAIPRLGDLRQLPRDDQGEDQHAAAKGTETSAARSVGFGLFAFVAAGCLLVAAYCGIRWFLTDVGLSTEEHIAALRDEYKTLQPAKLIREYESMEEFGLELPEPFRYKVIENSKRSWGQSASVAATAGVAALITSWLIGFSGRRARAA